LVARILTAGKGITGLLSLTAMTSEFNSFRMDTQDSMFSLISDVARLIIELKRISSDRLDVKNSGAPDISHSL
jgi:hypothetical protein